MVDLEGYFLLPNEGTIVYSLHFPSSLPLHPILTPTNNAITIVAFSGNKVSEFDLQISKT